MIAAAPDSRMNQANGPVVVVVRWMCYGSLVQDVGLTVQVFQMDDPPHREE